MVDSMIVGILDHFTAEDSDDVMEPGRHEEEGKRKEITKIVQP